MGTGLLSLAKSFFDLSHGPVHEEELIGGAGEGGIEPVDVVGELHGAQ